MKRLFFIFIIFLNAVFLQAAYADIQSGQKADVVLGQKTFTTNTAATTNSGMNAPHNVFCDGKRLIVSEFTNNRVLIWNTIPTANGTPADVVVGQVDFVTAIAAITRTGMNGPTGVFSDGQRLFVSDFSNRRVLIWNSIPTTNGAPADVVVGQPDFTTNSAAVTASKMSLTVGVFSDGRRLFVADSTQNRVLVWNSIPTRNGTPADLVIGQPDFTTSSSTPGQATLSQPRDIYSDGKRLVVTELGGNRVLIWNSIPTTNGAPADVVLGQQNFTAAGAGAGESGLSFPDGLYIQGEQIFVGDRNNNRVVIWDKFPNENGVHADRVLGQDTLSASAAGLSQSHFNTSIGVHGDGKRLFVADTNNNRVLIFNVADVKPKLGPQFNQGKSVLGKVFDDPNGNGRQDEGEKGLEGIKVVSDTGIYAITDSDGKYHFPYIETGEHVLKIDETTLPEGSVLTTDSPQKITVTEGVLTKVSFGAILLKDTTTTEGGPLLKVSVSQDPLLLKPRLSIEASKAEDKLIFTIQTNYHLFIDRSELVLYDKSLNYLKTIELPNPPPLHYELPLTEELLESGSPLYYQLKVTDKGKDVNRTKVGVLTL